jgi:S-adenosylmethionine:tRNA ribosyltransferase-isomerase
MVERADGRTFELLVCDPGESAVGDQVRAWVRGAKRLRTGDELSLGGLRLRHLDRDTVDPRARVFELVAGSLMETLERRGALPLPPYIERDEGPTDADRQRYQTTFARAPGSVAAPTAGLHFDQDLLGRLDHVRLTLHVGPGTFLPMDCDDVREHRVGAERYEISPDAASRIESARGAGRDILAIGTTVTRTLEGVAARNHGRVVAGAGTTDLVITPGHEFRVVDRLLTNFHLPRSSLLMLVASFGGRARVLSAYSEAVRAGYRFYSFGDCMLLGAGGAQT